MSRTISVILFDLDQTLYHPSTGLLQASDAKINRYLAQELDLPLEEADTLRKRLWRQYGTTARGAEMEFGLSQPKMYEASIKDVNPAEYLEPDPALLAMLKALDAELYVMTNSIGHHADRVLEALGIADCFAGVFDICSFDWCAKPDTQAYECVLAAVKQPAEEIALIEDFAHNLPPAAALGIFTVYLGPGSADADLCIEHLLDLPKALRNAGVVLERKTDKAQKCGD